MDDEREREKEQRSSYSFSFFYIDISYIWCMYKQDRAVRDSTWRDDGGVVR